MNSGTADSISGPNTLLNRSGRWAKVLTVRSEAGPNSLLAKSHPARRSRLASSCALYRRLVRWTSADAMIAALARGLISGRLRRVSPVDACPVEGRLSEHIADPQSRQWELVFMPLCDIRPTRTGRSVGLDFCRLFGSL